MDKGFTKQKVFEIMRPAQSGSKMMRADMQGADMQGADTQGANTQGADTQGADTQVCPYKTTFCRGEPACSPFLLITDN